MEAKELVQSLRDRVIGGEDFGELANEYSEDPATNETGGELGFFAIPELSPPFDEVVSTMEQGDVSEVVQGEFGFHIIRLLERTEERLPTFENVKGDLREVLYQRKMADKFDKWLSKLKKGIYIEKRL